MIAIKLLFNICFTFKFLVFIKRYVNNYTYSLHYIEVEGKFNFRLVEQVSLISDDNNCKIRVKPIAV